MIEAYLLEQPYSVECSKCGMVLEFDTDVDEHLELLVKVGPCDCNNGHSKK